MTALDDMLATAEEVLALDEKSSYDEEHDELLRQIALGIRDGSLDLLGARGTLAAGVLSLQHQRDEKLKAAAAAPDLARALKAVAEVLNVDGETTFEAVRAAIERRLTEGE